MVTSLKQLTLSTAIGLALVGAGLQHPTLAVAATPQLAATQGLSQAKNDGIYIITFEEAGLLHYKGAVNGITSTAPRANGKLDVHSSAAQAYQGYLASQRSNHISSIDFALGRSLNVTHTYTITQNGIAAHLSPSEVARVAAMPGVKNVRPAGVEHLDTYRGPKFIGADTIWSGANTPDSVGTRGKGVTVGILDSGANSTHPSFANDTSCGFRSSMPKLIAVDCSTTDSNGFCNGPDPEAGPGNGHGVHTASTVAGDTIDNTVTPAPLLPDGVTMSGVAPCAAVVSYKVCQTDTCGGADILAGLGNAIADGVDVINFSISGGTNPWSDGDRAFLDAVDAGIFVAASAGNTRAATPDPVGEVNHLGPWMTTVAASTQDELIGPELAVTGPDALPPTPPDLAHMLLTPGSSTNVADTAGFVGKSLLTYPTNIEGCTATGAFPANYFSDAIAVVRRGACAFTEKVTNAFNAGAAMVVISNNQAGVLNMNTDGVPDVPNFSMTQEDGDALIAYAAGNNPPAPPADQIFANGFDPAPNFGVIADYNRAVINARQGDVLAGFSFRGPTPAPYSGETKPDITGPGVDIYAAVTAAEGSYAYYSGTSMSSPHIAGSAALLRAARPNWTVPEIKSAMLTTATNASGVQEDGTTPWNIDDVGAGRIDLTKAAMAGLTMNETYANFLAADPAEGGDIKTLNLPHLRNTLCEPDCTWTREFKNQLPASGTWDVSFVNDAGFTMTATPANFTLAPGATQSVEFKATPVGTLTTIAFGEAILTEQSALSPAQHLTIAVKSPPPTIEVNPAALNSTQAAGTSEVEPVTVTNIGGGTLNWNLGTTANGVLWDQPITVNSGLPSTYSTADDAGAWLAADFQMDSSGPVTKLTTYGFDNTRPLVAPTTITWLIYGDAAGAPDGNPNDDSGNAPVWTYTAAANSAGVTITGSGVFELDLAAAGESLNLSAGTYWLSVIPTYPDPFPAEGDSTAGPWNWATAAQQLNEAMFVGDEYGAPDWLTYTDFGGLPPTIRDVAFKVEGTISCGASWLALTPASDSLTAGASTAVTATFDSTGLADGDYTATACFESNDAANPLVTVPVTLHVAPPNPVQDPSFETTTSDGGSNPSWNALDSNPGAGGGTNFYSGYAHTGSYAAWFGAWQGGAETQYISQSVTFPATGPAFLNYWRDLFQLPDAAGTLTVSVDGTAVETTDLSTATATTAFEQQSIDVSSYADGAAHVIKIEYVYPDAGGTGVDGSFYIDDVTLDPTNVSTSRANSPATQRVPGARKARR